MRVPVGLTARDPQARHPSCPVKPPETGVCPSVNEAREPVYAYVDGMNLYYGALKRHPGYRWLDIPAMVANLVPGLTIARTRYYTARIKATFPGDPGPGRQRIYLEALQSRPQITIKEGVYADWPRWQRLDETRGLGSPNLFRPRLEDGEARRLGRVLEQAKRRQPPIRPFVLVKIRQTEEKGSDVNLATDLLKDALGTRECRTALVVTNDSDLAYPLEVVQEFGIRVILVNPFLQSNQREAEGLRRIPVHRRIQLEPSHLQASQLPDLITVQGRRLSRPTAWQ